MDVHLVEENVSMGNHEIGDEGDVEPSDCSGQNNMDNSLGVQDEIGIAEPCVGILLTRRNLVIKKGLMCLVV